MRGGQLARCRSGSGRGKRGWRGTRVPQVRDAGAPYPSRPLANPASAGLREAPAGAEPPVDLLCEARPLLQVVSQPIGYDPHRLE